MAAGQAPSPIWMRRRCRRYRCSLGSEPPSRTCGFTSTITSKLRATAAACPRTLWNRCWRRASRPVRFNCCTTARACGCASAQRAQGWLQDRRRAPRQYQSRSIPARRAYKGCQMGEAKSHRDKLVSVPKHWLTRITASMRSR